MTAPVPPRHTLVHVTDAAEGGAPSPRHRGGRACPLGGAVLGFIVGAVLTYSSVGAPELAQRGYSSSTVLGYLGVGLGALGALLGALLALVIDSRRPR